MKKLSLILMIFMLLLVLPTTTLAQPPTPNDVLDALVEALNDGDIDTLMAIHADEVVYHINPPPAGRPGTYTGPEAVRGWLSGFIDDNATITMHNRTVDDNVITAEGWHTDEGLRAMGVNHLNGIAQYTIVDGKIAQLDWTTTPESQARLDAAIAKVMAAEMIKPVEARAEAVNQGELELALAQHTDDAVYHITPPPAGRPDTYTGLAEIEGWLAGIVESNGKVTLHDYRVEGNVVTAASWFTTDGLQALGVHFLEGIEAYTIVDGKITDFSWTALPESQARLDAAVAARMAPDLVDLVNARAEAFNAGDLETMMTFYAEDAVYRIVPPPGRAPGTYTGFAEIQGRLETVLADNPVLDVTIRNVEDNVVTAFTRHSDEGLQAMGVGFIEGVEEYTIVDGKIVDFVWTTTDESMAKIGAAIQKLSAPPTPAEVVLNHSGPMNEGDLAGVMTYFAEDAVIELAVFPGTPDIYVGAEEIEAKFAELIEVNFEVQSAIIYFSGNTVVAFDRTYNDFTREMGIAPLEGFSVYTVEDGLITSFTWISTAESRADLADILAAE